MLGLRELSILLLAFEGIKLTDVLIIVVFKVECSNIVLDVLKFNLFTIFGWYGWKLRLTLREDASDTSISGCSSMFFMLFEDAIVDGKG